MSLRILISLLLISFLTSSCAVKTKAILYFKDGREVSGLGKITSSNKVKFKAFNSKTKTYNFSELSKVKVFKNGGTRDYVYVKMKNSGHKVLQQVIKGKVCLYQKVKEKYKSKLISGGKTPTSSPGHRYFTYDYYVAKDESRGAVFLTSSSLLSVNFVSKASLFFEDCPSLVRMIQEKKYTKKDLSTIVKYYNLNCK